MRKEVDQDAQKAAINYLIPEIFLAMPTIIEEIKDFEELKSTFLAGAQWASSRSIGEDGCKEGAIEFVRWRDNNFTRSVRKDRLNMYYSIEDKGKRNGLLTYLTIEQLYAKWQQSKGGKI